TAVAVAVANDFSSPSPDRCRRGAADLNRCAPTLRIALDHHRDRLASAEAEGREPAAQAALFEGVQQRDEHARAARADRMAEGDRAAVDVDARGVAAERANGREHDDGEGRVRLEQIDAGR